MLIKITVIVNGNTVLDGEVEYKYLPQLSFTIKEIYRIEKGESLEVSAHKTVFSSRETRDLKKLHMDLHAALYDIYLEVEQHES